MWCSLKALGISLHLIVDFGKWWDQRTPRRQFLNGNVEMAAWITVWFTPQHSLVDIVPETLVSVCLILCLKIPKCNEPGLRGMQIRSSLCQWYNLKMSHSCRLCSSEWAAFKFLRQELDWGLSTMFRDAWTGHGFFIWINTIAPLTLQGSYIYLSLPLKAMSTVPCHSCPGGMPL